MYVALPETSVTDVAGSVPCSADVDVTPAAENRSRAPSAIPLLFESFAETVTVIFSPAAYSALSVEIVTVFAVVFATVNDAAFETISTLLTVTLNVAV